ncbi:septal ring lytic transglycosylase RlpA family protein [Micavibrio aeruginosavorus]|uniref:Probable endolytic peptidoglycan transglycosylase RlpA n=1 Tax=Micavibrio aeruginosavorus (strain ARL-13) TaxID=856793 RepID=G2KT02_MICAA|nr:septal ring lytic transglycosylase RlpA family protein [Micavibrio aeruginosavorus]AEP10147.1 rare lipoprotein A family protein [Micavibrio aeruginosavorus ARL-13]
MIYRLLETVKTICTHKRFAIVLPICFLMLGMLAAGDVLAQKSENTAGFCRPEIQVGTAQNGVASWYGPGFHGRKTSSGEIYNMNELTAAHRTLPMDTMVKVTNKDNGETVIVRINDRGPYIGKRVIDLSLAAAKALDMDHQGLGDVAITVMCENKGPVVPGQKPATNA